MARSTLPRIAAILRPTEEGGMGVRHTAILAVPLATLVAGCSILSPGGLIRTGSVARQVETSAVPLPPAPVATPSLAGFEATDLASGLNCTGNYNPLENEATIDTPVVCEDGRMGRVTAARSRDLSGGGTLVLANGAKSAVALRRIDATTAGAPPAAVNQLPDADPFEARL